MRLLKQLGLTAKGFCMGIADVIPGVSGGTMALILGIYVEFIEALKSINVRFVTPTLRWIGTGFKRSRFESVKSAFATIHIRFLFFLGIGIVTAFALGSKIIPDLMESYPIYMRAFFFGLILASVWVPYRMMEKRGLRELLAAILVGGAGFLLVGLSAGAIERWELREATGAGETMEELVETVPSALTPSQLLQMEENSASLATIAAANDAESFDLEALAAAADPRHTMVNDWIVPEGTPIRVPIPPYGWLLLCGIIAICAMMLPGVSGSFMLLALGTYYFMLNALKGFISGLTSLSVSSSHVIFVGLFILGALLGMVAFSRLLSLLFQRYASVTLAAMTGLMLGCLRAIWPFRAGGANVLPDEIDGVVIGAIAICLAGAAIVIVLNFIGSRRSSDATPT